MLESLSRCKFRISDCGFNLLCQLSSHDADGLATFLIFGTQSVSASVHVVLSRFKMVSSRSVLCLQDVLQAWKPWKCRTKAEEEKQRNLGAEIDLESGPSTMPNQSTEGRLNGHPTPAIVSPD